MAKREPVHRGNSSSVEVVDTVGAGDALVEGFLSGWLRGKTEEHLGMTRRVGHARAPCRAM